MARRRDYRAEYRRRQALARKLGYGSYYQRRVRQGAPPSSAAPSGERLRRARGHTGPADLERLLRGGRVSVLNQEPIGARDPDSGQYDEIRVTAMLSDGTQQTFRLRGRQLDKDAMRPLRQAATDAGADVYTNPSLDILRLRDQDVVELRAYSVLLVKVKPKRLTRVRATVRRLLNLTWKEVRALVPASMLVRDRPVVIVADVDEAYAEDVAAELQEAGGIVEVEEHSAEQLIA